MLLDGWAIRRLRGDVCDARAQHQPARASVRFSRNRELENRVSKTGASALRLIDATFALDAPERKIPHAAIPPKTR